MSAIPEAVPDDLSVVRAALADEYEVLEELGHGGMAVVYRARERALDRDVAIKVLPPSRLADRELVERFQREARTSAQLEHPHIVPIYHVGRRGAVNFFVMQLLRGESLAARLAREGPLPVPEIRRILAETAGALGHAARGGIVHRDVKPDNILLDHDGRCVMTDFGIARSMSSTRLTAAGMSIGTPRYMSPEQARGEAVDGRSDIYSLGVVAYECLAGRPPFDGDDAFAVLLGHVQSPVPRPPLVSAEARALYAIIERMLAKSPAQRFQRAEEVIAALAADGAAFGSGAHATRAVALTAPLRQVTVPLVVPGDDESVPRPAPELDAAMRVGVEMLRRQEPKVRAHLAAGRALARRTAPRLRDAAVRTAGFVYAVAVHAFDLAAAAGRRLLPFARGRGRRLALPLAVTLVASLGAYGGVRYVALHRSRCPASFVNASAGGEGDRTGARARPLALLVDAVGPRRAGSDLDVWYDVCGLPAATAFTTRIAVVTNASILTRLFGHSVDPITADFAETASGPATRRHRAIAFDRMPPGSYTLDVVITDRSGRRRERAVGFQVLDE